MDGTIYMPADQQYINSIENVQIDTTGENQHYISLPHLAVIFAVPG